jgi:hypothetical protein
MRSHYLELNVDSLMKDKKLEANLSMVASRVMAGLNMNGLIAFVVGSFNGCYHTVCVCGSGFLVDGLFYKRSGGYQEATHHAVLPRGVRALRIYVLLSAGHQQNHSGFECHIQFDAAYMGISHFRFLSARESYGNEDYRYSFGVWRCDVVYLDAGQR